jgi:hypothetical protein
MAYVPVSDTAAPMVMGAAADWLRASSEPAAKTPNAMAETAIQRRRFMG